MIPFALKEDGRSIPYKSISITFAPTVLIILLAVVLALIQKKNVLVDIELVADQISFSVESDNQAAEYKSIPSVPAESIVLTMFKEARFSADEFSHEEETVQIQGEVLILPRENSLCPRVRFAGEDIYLAQLDIGIGSKVTFYRPEGRESVDIKIEAEPSDESIMFSGGTISLGNSFKLLMRQCDLIDEEGNVLIGGDETVDQNVLEVYSSFGEASFSVGDDPEGFYVLLEMPEKDTRTLFSIAADDHGVFRVMQETAEEDVTLFTDILIREIDFNDYNIAPGGKSTVRSGSMRFKSIRKDSITVESGDSVFISERDALMVVKLWSRPGDDGLGIVICGSVDSLQLGKYPPVEQLPSLLECLYSDKRLCIIAAILTWMIAQTLTIGNLVVEIRKRTG